MFNQHPLKVTLEAKCIKKYNQNYYVEIFPFDIDVAQKTSKYQDGILSMFHIFFENEDYKKLDDEQDTFIAQEGFHYLNSDKFLDYLEKKELIEKNIVESEFYKDSLFDIYKLFRAEQCDNRENAMIQNIYNYSNANQYNQAVFLIGAEHKKSIKRKIAEFEKLSEIKLNWTMYGSK